MILDTANCGKPQLRVGPSNPSNIDRWSLAINPFELLAGWWFGSWSIFPDWIITNYSLT